MDRRAEPLRGLLIARVDRAREALLELVERAEEAGLTKSKIDQISERRFSIGVPVSARRRSALSRLAARAVALSGFLMFCASSRIA